MRQRKFSLFLSLVVLASTSLTFLVILDSALAANPKCDAVDGDYIVSFNSQVKARDEMKLAPGKPINAKFIFDSVLNGFASNLSAQQVCAFANRPNIESIELDQTMSSDAVSIQDVPLSWNLDRIDSKPKILDFKYSYSSNGFGVNAYIVDTGINSSHGDFSGRIANGFSSIAGGTEDCNGHGTHVAGTIGGSNYGVSKMVKLIPVRVLDCNGSGSNSGVIAGLDWISKQSNLTKSVVNMSLGGGASTALDSAVIKLTSAGATVVVAAGNSKRDACNFSPSRVASAITVAASDRNDQLASFSNYGKCVDIIAPGVNITSDWIGSNAAINTISGTSMASPHVAGAIARYLSVNLPITAAAISTSNLVGGVPRGTSNLLLYVDPSK